MPTVDRARRGRCCRSVRRGSGASWKSSRRRGRDAAADASGGAGGLSLVSAAPVEPTVRSVRLVGRATEARRDAERAGRTSGALVVTSGAEKAPGYATVGVTWSGGQLLTEEDVEVAVRTRGAGVWTPWQEMHFDPDHGPEPAEDDAEARGGTDAVVVGDVRRVQARVTVLQGETPTGMELDIVDPGDERRGELEAPAIDTASLGGDDEQTGAGDGGERERSAPPRCRPPASPPPSPRSSRAASGAPTSRCGTRGRCATATINGGFVHHTVNANNYSRDQVPSLLRGIYAYHTRSLGWSDIGYNFLVDRFGRVWEGRYGGVARPVVGAHTLGYNEDSFAMSAIGNFETVQPSRGHARRLRRAVRLEARRCTASRPTTPTSTSPATASRPSAVTGTPARPPARAATSTPRSRRSGAPLRRFREAGPGEPPKPPSRPSRPAPKPADPVTTDRDADISGQALARPGRPRHPERPGRADPYRRPAVLRGRRRRRTGPR